MGQKKSNKKNKKSVADLIIKHHYDDKIKKNDKEFEKEELSSDNQELKEETVEYKKNDEGTVSGEEILEVKIDDFSKPIEEDFEEVEKDNPEKTKENLKDVEAEITEKLSTVEADDFLKNADEILNSVEEKNKTNSDEAVQQLQEFLSRVDKRVDKLAKVQAERENEIDIVGDEFQFKKFKNELTFFQNELEEGIHGQFSDLSETVTSVILELKNRISEMQDYVEQDTTKQIKTVISGIKTVKAEVDSISNEVKSIDKQSIFDTEKRTKQIIGLTKKTKDELLTEIQNLKNVVSRADVLETYNEENKLTFEKTNKQNIELFNKTNAENIALFETRSAESLATVKNELSQVRQNLHTQIQEVLRKIVIQDEIKSLCEDALTEIRNNNSEIGVVRKFMKATQAVEQRQEELLDEIRILVEDLSEYELNEASDKVDIIYENIGMLNEWANKSDKLIEDFDILREDFDINSDKVDIIYDNLTFINDWVKKLDKFAKDIEDLKSDFERDEKLTEKIDSLYTNINAIKDWSKKADALALQVRALSVQISETESTINSQNLADIRELFTQMTEDMSNLSSRTNKMILDTDKTNDKMVAHLENLNSIIETLRTTSNSFEFDEIKNKIEEIKDSSTKNSNFELIITEAFGYLAEWIDSAGVTINQIQKELNNVQYRQDEQVEQINKQYNEQVDRLEEIKTSFENLVQKDDKTENSIAESIAEIFTQNNLAIQNIVKKQNQEFQEILALQNVQIKKILEEQQNLISQNLQIQKKLEEQQNFAVQNEEISNQDYNQQHFEIQSEQIGKVLEGQQLNSQRIIDLQNQLAQTCDNVQQYQIQSEQMLQNLEQLQEQAVVSLSQMNEQSDKLLQNIQNMQNSQSDISSEIQDLQQPSSVSSNNEEILEKLGVIAEYIEQKDESQQIVESIEEKISTLKPDNSEVKNLLDFIAAQVVNANENSLKTETLSRKIDTIETKLSSLEQYMARLIEYLDEDE